jgi:hypothetical protein
MYGTTLTEYKSGSPVSRKGENKSRKKIIIKTAQTTWEIVLNLVKESTEIRLLCT